MEFFSYTDPDRQVNAESRSKPLRPVLREFSDEDLDTLDSFVAELRFAAGSRIIAAGERNDALFIVVSGSIRITVAETGKTEREVDRLVEGEVFGISSFLDGEASAISASTLESTELLALRRTSFDQLAAWKPSLAIAVLTDLAAYTSRRLRQLQIAC
ncbi:Cyclic nucleotide-binding protein [Candidatus Accumulibacter aalborgensis]|uniref:Cyclic nucleotide-binding protein n=1 Tax=Candidatus Accumulibacter aalborgensis TaxID=1860102 RepID=A0A1A8XTF4_9PROT|nr:cyclic nucleotide-binding domain-containing protein [Candidatus Accumulibacter aalborgensis]SBT07223.1 Cyclic nucleotide-binding protein [Candidatus Accumulibacter aalborgensis]